MKANKALKRLAKIEASVSDLAKRFLPSAPQIREVLHDAKAAVIRAKEAVLQASAGTAKKKTGAPKRGRPAKNSAAALKKGASKKTVVKVSARTAKKRAPVKKAAKKVAAKKAAAKRVDSVLVPATTETAPQESPLTSATGGV